MFMLDFYKLVVGRHPSSQGYKKPSLQVGDLLRR